MNLNTSFRKLIGVTPDREMKPYEYLDLAKKMMQIETDYQLAKRFKVPNSYVAKIRQGTRPISPTLATKIAITLGIDPMTIIADIEVQRDKSPEHTEFWRSFLSRAD